MGRALRLCLSRSWSGHEAGPRRRRRRRSASRAAFLRAFSRRAASWAAYWRRWNGARRPYSVARVPPGDPRNLPDRRRRPRAGAVSAVRRTWTTPPARRALTWLELPPRATGYPAGGARGLLWRRPRPGSPGSGAGSWRSRACGARRARHAGVGRRRGGAPPGRSRPVASAASPLGSSRWRSLRNRPVIAKTPAGYLRHSPRRDTCCCAQ